MRPKTLSFEQLVKQNKQELLEDENSISRIERKLENRKMGLIKRNRQKKKSTSNNES